MKVRSRIVSDYKNGNLHIQIKGDFNGSAAFELLNIIQSKYNGNGLIVIDTHGIKRMLPFGIATFNSRLEPKKVPLDRLVFRGEMGLKIMPEGSHVLTEKSGKSCQCDGRCKQCSCRTKDQKPGDLFRSL